MTEQDAFLRAIRADPTDDTARLVFADWLDEHDQPDRAEFIRLQVASPGKLCKRQKALWAANWPRWCVGLPGKAFAFPDEDIDAAGDHGPQVKAPGVRRVQP